MARRARLVMALTLGVFALASCGGEAESEDSRGLRRGTFSLLMARTFVVLALVLTGCGSSGDGGGLEVSRADFGADWPLTVQSGTLNCEGAGAVTFTTNGTTYAVNGLASGMDEWPEIDSIWANAPHGLKKDIGPLIDRGLELCDL
jgi:Protein of unknown function (DUF2511)